MVYHNMGNIICLSNIVGSNPRESEETVLLVSPKSDYKSFLENLLVLTKTISLDILAHVITWIYFCRLEYPNKQQL